MEIGVIGINQFAHTLCRHWILKGHRIFFADPFTDAHSYSIAAALGPQVRLLSPEKIAQDSEFIVMAVTSRHLLAAINAIGNVRQKIVVDLVQEPRTTAPHESSFRRLQQLLPEARVVKLTNKYPLEIPHPDIEYDKVLYCYSTDGLAQRLVHSSIAGSGFITINLQI